MTREEIIQRLPERLRRHAAKLPDLGSNIDDANLLLAYYFCILEETREELWTAMQVAQSVCLK